MQRCGPGTGALAAPAGRDPKIVNQFGAWATLELVLSELRLPSSRKIDLREGGNANHHGRHSQPETHVGPVPRQLVPPDSRPASKATSRNITRLRESSTA